MVKRIIHISDIHIPNTEDERPYSDMIKKFLSQLYLDIQKIKETGITDDEIRIVLAGDIFHQKVKITNEAREMFHILMNFLNALGKVIVYAGNHDLLENNRNKKDSLSPTFAINGVYPNITFIDKELNYQSGIIQDDNIIWVLYSIFDKFKQPEMTGLRQEYPNHKIIGLYHGNIPGATTDVGAIIDKGIDTNIFNDCDCVMAGHIHKFQELKHNGVPVVYAGSLFQQDCGENVTGHGYLIWNMENMSYKHKEVLNDYRTYKFKISSYEDISNNEEKLINL